MGWSEMLVIGIVALIVVGPQELPMLFRKIGQFVGKARGMAREFTRAMDDAADQTGLKEISKIDPLKATGLDQVKSATSWSDYAPGSETEKLAKERAASAKRIHEATAKREADKKAAAEAAAKAAAEKSTADKTPAKKAEAKKATAKKPAKKTQAVKKEPAKKPAKKPAAKAPATSKGSSDEPK